MRSFLLGLKSVSHSSCVSALLGVWMVGCSSSSTTTRQLEDKPTGVVQEVDEFVYLAKAKQNNTSDSEEKVDTKVLRSASSSENLPENVNRDKLLLEVVRYLGVRYSYGGNTSRALDCSGYVTRVFYGAFGQKLPRSTYAQFKAGEKIDRGSLRIGDLVFFNTTGTVPSHVGIYLEDGIFAHASVTEGVTLSSIDGNYYKSRYVGARRVIVK